MRKRKDYRVIQCVVYNALRVGRENALSREELSRITGYRDRLVREAIEALSSVLWGYTSKDSLDMLEQFFPEPKSSSGQSGK